MSSAKDPRGPQNIEPEVFEVLWRLYRSGETDLLDGGVTAYRIAREVDRNRTTVRGVLARLKKQGVVQPVDGAAPDNYRARRSWVPTALFDGGEEP